MITTIKLIAAGLCLNLGDGVRLGGGLFQVGFDAVGELDPFDELWPLVLAVESAPGSLRCGWFSESAQKWRSEKAGTEFALRQPHPAVEILVANGAGRRGLVKPLPPQAVAVGQALQGIVSRPDSAHRG